MNTWRWDEPEEKLYWYSKCLDCKWEEEQVHDHRDDCTTDICPECGSDRITDIETWM